jgi:hypothetical protein
VRLLRKYLALDWADRLIFIEAWLYLGAARLALLTIPFRVIARRLGRQLKVSDLSLVGSVPPPVAFRVGTGIETMARHTPWESACLAQAIAGRFMLGRRALSSRLYLGTRKDESGNLVAHAWLQSGNTVLLGQTGHQEYVVLSVFGHPDA